MTDTSEELKRKGKIICINICKLTIFIFQILNQINNFLLLKMFLMSLHNGNFLKYTCAIYSIFLLTGVGEFE